MTVQTRLDRDGNATYADRAPLFPDSATKTSHARQAGQFLAKAAALMAQRGQAYDQPDGERSMGKAVVAFNAITGMSLAESEGWLLMQLLKDARQWSTGEYHADSAEDCVAYAALKAEALAKGD